MFFVTKECGKSSVKRFLASTAVPSIGSHLTLKRIADKGVRPADTSIDNNPRWAFSICKLDQNALRFASRAQTDFVTSSLARRHSLDELTREWPELSARFIKANGMDLVSSGLSAGEPERLWFRPFSHCHETADRR
ncbi:MAG: hypothetical protein AB7U75_12800 [Hyphomicrobiaceae bacterium]